MSRLMLSSAAAARPAFLRPLAAARLLSFPGVSAARASVFLQPQQLPSSSSSSLSSRWSSESRFLSGSWRSFAAEAASSSSSSSAAAAEFASQEPIKISWNIPRTHSFQLPVYTRLRNSGTRRQTVIRKVEGNVGDFIAELQKLLGPHVTIARNETNGNIVISGSLHAPTIKRWLTGLGL